MLFLLALPVCSAVVREYVLNLTATYQAPNGFYREMFLVNNQHPGPLIEADEGDTISATVINNLLVPMTIHWHGIRQKDTPWMDGAPGVSQRPIFPGESFVYNFTTEGQYGSYWYHAHMRSYYQDGIKGPIYIRPASHTPRPYDVVTEGNPTATEILMGLERNPTPLYVMDWTKLPTDAIYQKAINYGIDPACVLGYLINGKGRVTCPSNETLATAGAGRLATYAKIAPGVQAKFDSLGCLDISHINGYPGIDNVALEAPGFSSPCQPTSTAREIFYVNGSDWMMFNVINMGGAFGTHLSIDGHDMWVLQVDGTFIKPSKVKQMYAGLGSRYMIAVPTQKDSGVFAIRFACTEMAQITEQIAWLSYNMPDSGPPEDYPVTADVYQDIGGSLLNPQLPTFNDAVAAPYDVRVKPPEGPAQRTIHFTLNRTGVVEFSVMDDGALMLPDMELMTPSLWAEDMHRTGIVDAGIEIGDVVDLIIDNKYFIPHPMHLHGHTFWVISESNTSFGYPSVEAAIASGSNTVNLANPPYRDTYTAPSEGHIVFRYVADNAGAWMFHCHVNIHLMSGMGTIILEDRETIIPSIPESILDF
ncbi:multicopper oxidase-domain-containing protein [Lipomyces kononenkoae]|uniref:Multicopper oxidase-domain-containing protein n=1 Tax=Lipomyces kononenkoae TaxID=34357 RepID=A0ACC3ST08_LIPKO